MDIGTWVRAGTLIGIVSKIEADDFVTVFNPGERQMLRAHKSQVRPLPTGEIEARVALRVEVPHGLSEDSMRRWLAALIDPQLRVHAQTTMIEHGLDDAPFKLHPTVIITEAKRKE